MTVESLEEKAERYAREGVDRIKLGLTDIDGVIRGKTISLAKFTSLATGASGFCDCILGWDIDDKLYDNSTYTGWHTGFPDARYRLDGRTERRLSDEGGIPYFIGDLLTDDDADDHPLCPRGRLKQVLRRLETLGFHANMAFEYEFFVFNETPDSVRQKNFQNLTPINQGNFGYSVLKSSVHADLFNDYFSFCRQMNFPLEGLHCESGPGVWEAAITVDEALVAADKAALMKTFTKAFFQRRDLMATFMARWHKDYPGQSGHCHQSLVHADSGNSAFVDQGRQSDTMRHYLGGLQRYLKPLQVLFAPTINSYVRLVPGYWAPTAATWGVENRTCAIRLIPGSASSQRLELRISGADANPYLVAAATVGAGLLGIEQRIEPGEAISGNAYEAEASLPPEQQLAGNLRAAAEAFAGSAAAADLFGQAFVEHYAASREWEARQYDRAVTDWQLRRYFEII